MDRNLAVWAVEHAYQVALRKESVDRNFPVVWAALAVAGSLSARRAWIEMPMQGRRFAPSMAVALRKESVDRNLLLAAGVILGARRSPQGERG